MAFVKLIRLSIFIILMFAVNISATTIADEDFESGTTGWSNNTTESATNFTRYLGRFGGTGGAQHVYKTFALSGNQDQVSSY